MENTKIEEAFQFVRKIFFPKWDRKRQWKVQFDPDLPSDGKCDQETKTIVIRHIAETNDKRYSLLIHEICHSSASGHGKKFCDRMLRAAERVEELGHVKLSQMIKEDVALCKQEPCMVYTAKVIYEKIEDILIDQPTASYECIIEDIARDFGVYPHEIEKNFKQCRKVYDREFKRRQAGLSLNPVSKPSASLRKKGGSCRVKLCASKISCGIFSRPTISDRIIMMRP